MRRVEDRKRFWDSDALRKTCPEVAQDTNHTHTLVDMKVPVKVDEETTLGATVCVSSGEGYAKKMWT